MMRPIEIHIEGYKIIIMEDKEPEPTKVREEDVIKYVPYPVVPTKPTTGDWWQHPFATWTADDVLNGTSTASDFHPVRDIMVGKKVTDESA